MEDSTSCLIFELVTTLLPVPWPSLFILSNETVNMWSHLLGFLLFFLLGAYNMAAVLPAIGASREDFVIYCICIFCFQVNQSQPASPLC